MPLAEKAIIGRIRHASRLGAAVKTGIGDDCAVLRIPPGHQALVTTDFSLEGVHFRRDWHSPESASHRCLTRGLSDIAAMGGEPLAAFLSLALPKSLPQAWADRFIKGLLKLAEKFNVTLAGGDTAASPNGILADIVVVGSVPRGTAILRSGARPGDLIYVTGQLGASAAAIQQLSENKKIRQQVYSRHFFPEPRIEVGQFLRKRNLATAMIDLSDGLSTDLSHICKESGVGAKIIAGKIPRSKLGKPLQAIALNLALHGGEDYELLFTAPPGKKIPSQITGVAITQIGEITRARKMVLVDENGKPSELKPHGWEHFSGTRQR